MEAGKQLYVLCPRMTEDFLVRSAEMGMVAEVVREHGRNIDVYIETESPETHNLLRRYCRDIGVETKTSQEPARLLAEIQESARLISALVTQRDSKSVNNLSVSASERGIRTEVREKY